MTKKKKNSKEPRSPRNWAGKAGWIAAIALAFLSMGLLLGVYGNYMRKIEALSLFVPTASYYHDFAVVPGGPLSWCGAFLTQFMYYPALGALIFTALLLAIYFVAARAFKLKGWWAPLGAVPAAAVLLVFVSYAYDIFTLKPIGYAFALPLGVLFALCCAWICAALRRWWWLRAALAVGAVAVGYSLFGFFALLAGALCALREVLDREQGWRRFAVVALAAVAIWLTPQIWYRAVGGNLMPSQMYVSGLPRLFVAETGMRVRYALVFGSLGLLALLWPVLI